MKLILAQPAIPRFQWELDVLITNIRKFTDMEVVLLFAEHDFTVPIHFREKWGCSVFVYSERDDRSYIPSVRPWLLWQYFKEDRSREKETYFYIDSDIIFRELPDFTTLDISEKTIVGSDCGGYLDYEYIKKCTNGDAILAEMGEICGIDPETIKDKPAIGAHIILNQTSAEFWERCYNDSNKLWHYFEGVDTNLQKWTAEMWAQLWGWYREGYKISNPNELDFCMATDPIEKWDQFKIMHNAGVTVDRSHELFFKGAFVNASPFGKDFSYVRRDKASYRYVEAIEKVIL